MGNDIPLSPDEASRTAAGIAKPFALEDRYGAFGWVERRLQRAGVRKAVVIVMWALMLLGICIRVGLSSGHNIFSTYEAAGRDWLAGRNLYTTTQGRSFVYSPLAAAFFAPFSLLPTLLSNILWRFLNAFVFASAVRCWLGSGINGRLTDRGVFAVWILLLPLSLGNFNNGQANPLVIGLVMFAILAVRAEEWWLGAFCIAGATYLKVYPLATGLLLAVVFPRKFAWRLVAALAVLGAFTFLCQSPFYVLAQTHRWIETRVMDDRQLYGSAIAPHDLLLVFRTMHFFISERAYAVVQILCGAGVALVCLAGRVGGWPEKRLLSALFTLVCCWMVLLGPATESPTYVLLAPAVVLACIQGYEEQRPQWLRGLALAALCVLLLGFAINSFILKREPYRVVQPIGALFFTCYAAIWVLTPAYWREGTVGPQDRA